MRNSVIESVSAKIKIYARSPTNEKAERCRRCAAGWTRTRKDGGIVTVCLLDREVVLAGMTDCDRYELREETQQPEIVKTSAAA